jgi:hypothetical protein
MVGAQAPGGLIFPDKATLYIGAIEDEKYKDEKIHCTRDVCKSVSLALYGLWGALVINSLGQRVRVQHELHQGDGVVRAVGRYRPRGFHCVHVRTHVGSFHLSVVALRVFLVLSRSRRCCSQTIDIMKAKVEDLTFTAPFTVRFTRDDYCHALVAWFDVEFSFCHKAITLSTCTNP